MKWQTKKDKSGVRSFRRISASGRAVLFSAIGFLALAGLGWVGFTVESVPAAALKPVQDAPVVPAYAPPELLAEAPPEVAQPEAPAAAAVSSQEVLFLARREAGHSHLWAYQEGQAAPIPLTSGDWNDVDPSVSPDGRWLAFASNRAGGWDLYVQDISSGETRRLTETPGYEGHPTWSPDSRWVAYETFYVDNFDIFILPIDGQQSPLQLTVHPGSDLSPTWDPKGRRIAFTSNRDGSQHIYMADLDAPTDPYLNLTAGLSHAAYDPAFSPDGTRLAYAASEQGVESIWVLDLGQPRSSPVWVGLGGKPAWRVTGEAISGVLETPQRGHLVSYAMGAGPAPQPPPTAGRISRLSWAGVASAIVGSDMPAPELSAASDEPEKSPQGRLGLKPLSELSPAGLVLSDAVDEAFLALRSAAATELGWDFLGNLGYAFVGINDPLPPGFAFNDWLYTGRAFAFNQAAFQAGWVEVVREDFGAQTYWRVFVRAAQQDGSLGAPLHLHPWDFSARYLGDPVAYDQGGNVKSEIPPGYFVDFTELSADFGFERVPALHNWRTYFPAARFDEFARTDGMDWANAMLEIYPPSAIVTPTPYQTPTPTPSRTPRPTPTPWWWRWRTPTPTFTPLPPSTATTTPTP